MTDAEETVEEIEMLSVEELSFELRILNRLEGAFLVDSPSPFIVLVEEEAMEPIEA
jgi:hypothetical protein